MGALSIWHLLILLAVIMLVIGAGKRHVVSDFLGDVGKGVRRIRTEAKGDDE